MKKRVLDLISRAPHLPGVYIMKNKQGDVLYIGKALRLIDRLKSYIQYKNNERLSVRYFVPKIHDVEWLVTQNEKEALLLESSLIKSYQPKYNIDLKDGKTYLSLALSHHKYSRLYYTRKIKEKNNSYFGPYDSAQSVKIALKEVQKIFKLRDCTDTFFKQRKRPCLKYQIKRCSAPCVNKIQHKEYLNDINKAKNFLSGKKEVLLKKLNEEMLIYSNELNFEKAAQIRNRIFAIKKVMQVQRFNDSEHSQKNLDFIGYFGDENGVLLKLLSVIEGRVSKSLNFYFDEPIDNLNDILEAFIRQYYLYERVNVSLWPQNIYINFEFKYSHLYSDVLSEKAKRKINLKFIQKGKLFKTLDLAMNNAKISFEEQRRKSDQINNMLMEMKRKFLLKNIPKKIEGYDISNIQGTDPIASQVVFVEGVADKKQYRFYHIKTVVGPNDFAMMKEVFSRRLAKLDGKNDPDLILVDGGKGQLAQALAVFKELNIEHIDVISIAKEKTWKNKEGSNSAMERVFIPNQANAIVLKPGSRISNLLQSIRDESHRFALKNHRKTRQKRTLSSDLDGIYGLGPKRKQQLIKNFKSIEKVKRASLQEILSIEGFPKALAQKIVEHFS